MNSYSDKLASDIAVFRTYSKYLPHLGRRESFEETVNRWMTMHLDRFPKLSFDIVKAAQRVHDKKVMPSMRSLQFAGEAILKNEARSYNCSYAPIIDSKVFSEALFLLLSGVGFGFSVQKHHVKQLPKVQRPRETGIYLVHDSIQGWAEALNALMEAYFYGKIRPQFDLTQVRPKGSYLVTTGNKAPGPEPLRKMLEEVEARLALAIGRQLRTIEVYDIVCLISDSVLAGGIRRSALICLFDKDDSEMMNSKTGEWWVKNPQRARSNNSVLLHRNRTSKEEFDSIFKTCQNSGAGEPGFVWTNDDDMNMGTNPCVTGDTKILTKDGNVRIDEVVNTEVEVWNGFEWSRVTPKITGYNQPLVTVSFSDGRSLTCTEYHNFHIELGYSGKTDIVKAKDLVPGMKLMKHDFPIITDGPELDDAYTNGLVSAEGMELSRTLYIYKPKEMCIERMSNKRSVNWEENNNRYRIILDKTPVSKNFVPIQYNLKSKLEWLSGLFDGDATELRDGGLQLVSVNRNFLSDLQELLMTLGVQSKITKASDACQRLTPNHRGYSLYDCKELNRILIGSTQMQSLKQLGLKCERLSFDKSSQIDTSQFVTISDITESGTADIVYCFTEPKRHTGIFNGVLTGQCGEIALEPFEFCNLSTINQSNIKDKRDFMNRVHSATLIGTLQASYTDFHYLRPIWKETTEMGALLGVSFTGIADGNGVVTQEWLEQGAKFAKEINSKYANKIGISPAARITTVKPEGTASVVLGTSSGIHARHSKYYIRRIRMNKNDSLATYLKYAIPELVEDDVMNSTGVVVSLPQKSPDNAILREHETALSLFTRTILYNKHWISNGHDWGKNKHNVSVTISVKDHEWDELREAMWTHKGEYNGISLLPYDGGTYVQAPFEECSEQRYEEMFQYVKDIDLRNVKEDSDNTNRVENLACAGGQCEIT